MKEQIEARLGPHALLRPTFYCNPGGLRFELSTGGSSVEQFLTAHRKASLICREVFKEAPTFAVCLSVFMFKPAQAFRGSLRSLRHAGIRIPRTKEMWVVVDSDDMNEVMLHVSFVVDQRLLDNLLWCALAVDLRIEPSPQLAAIRLIDMERRVLVHPYDDRGMDVIGPNRGLLTELYSTFNAELLEHDREIMAATFG